MIMMKDRQIYYGSKLSSNLTETPEGFLICHSVPIARIGWYEYLDSELGVGNDGKIISVYRSPEEVFDSAGMASFNGMPVTDEHPPVPVDAENAMRYARGVVQNVRQGKGDDSDLLIADLIIHDKQLVNEVLSGKREVSCGYTCDYVDNDDGTYSQVDIRGNHCAIVTNGRAGDRVAIRDSESDPVKKYGITEKPGKARTAPKGKPENRESYGDPVNYAYPIDKEHIHAAISYFNHPGEKTAGDYTPEEWSIIGKRIAKAANNLLGEGYQYKDGRIVTPSKRMEDKEMAKKINLPRKEKSRVTDFLAAIGLKQFAQDAEPEDIKEAVDAMTDERMEEERHEERDRRHRDEEHHEKDRRRGRDEEWKEDMRDEDERYHKLEEKLNELHELVRKAIGEEDEDDPEKLIDNMIDELEAGTMDNDEEEMHTISPEFIGDEDGPVAPPEDRPKSAMDNSYKVEVLKAIKPILAKITDPAQRKMVADEAMKVIKRPAPKKTYASIQRGQRQTVQKANDSQTKDYSALGQDIAKRFNPHYKQNS